MSKTIILILCLIVLIALGLFYSSAIAEDTGYVLITIGNYKIEMTLVSAFIMLLGSALLIWVAVKMLRTFSSLGVWSWHWFSDFGSNRQKANYDKALLAWIAEDYETAEKYLKKVHISYQDGLVLLMKAKIAASKSDQDAQKMALLQAQKFEKTEQIATLQLADFYQSHNAPDEAAALLTDSSHKMALQMKLRALSGGGKWREAMTLLEDNKRQLPKQDFNDWKRKLAVGIFSEVASKEGAEALLSYWEQQPGRTKKDISLQAALIAQLIAQNYHQKAESYLVKFQPKAPVPELLPYFRQLKLKQPIDSKKKLEFWLKQDENNVDLLSTLGELSYNCGDIPLAEKALQKVIRLNRNPHDVQLLARVKEAVNDKDQALQLYKQVTESQHP